MNQLVKDTIRANSATMTCIRMQDILLLQNFLEEQEYYVCVADLTGLNTELDIFLHIVASLTQGDIYSRLHHNINWAALSDILIGIFKQKPKIAFLIDNADVLINNHLNLFFNLSIILVSQTQRLENKGIPALITTFLIGEGPNFVDDFPDIEEVDPSLEEKPVLRSQKERERDKAAHLERMKEGKLSWQDNMTEEQRQHMKKIIQQLP